MKKRKLGNRIKVWRTNGGRALVRRAFPGWTVEIMKNGPGGWRRITINGRPMVYGMTSLYSTGWYPTLADARRHAHGILG